VANDIGPVGDMERVLTRLIEGLTELGHNITAVARTCQGRLPGVHFVRVPGPPGPFWSPHHVGLPGDDRTCYVNQPAACAREDV
jgi:hypothetical protein